MHWCLILVSRRRWASLCYAGTRPDALPQHLPTQGLSQSTSPNFNEDFRVNLVVFEHMVDLPDWLLQLMYSTERLKRLAAVENRRTTSLRSELH